MSLLLAKTVAPAPTSPMTISHVNVPRASVERPAQKVSKVTSNTADLVIFACLNFHEFFFFGNF